MAVLSSNELSFKLKKQAKLASIVFKDPYLVNIIRFCNLKPVNAKDAIEKTKVHDVWIDQFGNSIKLTKKEKIITLNDLSICQHSPINTDLYCKLPIEKISKISKLIYFVSGKEEDFETDHFVFAFLGIDDILRSFCFIYDELISIPPLSMGYTSLRLISKNMKAKGLKTFSNKKNVVFPCKNQISFLSPWPECSEMTEILSSNRINLKGDFCFDGKKRSS